MPKYRIRLSVAVTDALYAYMEIDAPDEAAARSAALAQDDPQWEMDYEIDRDDTVVDSIDELKETALRKLL
jgi:hypothetical protein